MFSPEQLYLFDLNGFLVIRQVIPANVLAGVSHAVNLLEQHVQENVDKPPFRTGHYGIRYHIDTTYRYAANRYGDGGVGFVVEDFVYADPVFDYFVGEDTAASCSRELILGDSVIASMQVFFRYQGNFTPTHMGGLIDARNRYVFLGRDVLDTERGTYERRNFDLTVMRVIYALHDVSLQDGPLCVVPGSHKANFHSPYSGQSPEREPMMTGVEMGAGDMLIFTENLRHGGFPITSGKTRKTVHVTYQPKWTASMSAAHWNSTMQFPLDVYNRLGEKKKFVLPV